MLGKHTGLSVMHLDSHYWQPGWRATPSAAWRTKVRELVAEPAWVMDGNYTSTLDLRLPAADTIVFLDLPRALTLVRVVRRRWRWRGRTRPDMAPGCPERLTARFLLWVWRYPHDGRPRLLSAINAARAEERVVRLTSRRAINAWAACVTRSPRPCRNEPH